MNCHFSFSTCAKKKVGDDGGREQCLTQDLADSILTPKEAGECGGTLNMY